MNKDAALRLALEALIESRDDVTSSMHQFEFIAGIPRYGKIIAAYEAQLVQHDAAIVACEKALAKQEVKR